MSVLTSWLFLITWLALAGAVAHLVLLVIALVAVRLAPQPEPLAPPAPVLEPDDPRRDLAAVHGLDGEAGAA